MIDVDMVHMFIYSYVEVNSINYHINKMIHNINIDINIYYGKNTG